MKNYEKFKTDEERVRAFFEGWRTHKSSVATVIAMDFARFLSTEADEEKAGADAAHNRVARGVAKGRCEVNFLRLLLEILRYRNVGVRFRCEIEGVERELRLKRFCHENLVLNGVSKGSSVWCEFVEVGE